MRLALAVVALALLAPAAGAAFLVTPVSEARAAALPEARAGPLPEPLRVSSEVGEATVYPAWPVLTAELATLAAEHRDILRLHSAGKSGRGLDLWLVEIADFENPDRVPIESREVLWVDGGTHANEYSGVMFVMHLLRFLAQGYGENETATWIVENRHTWIMPLLNPEGSMNGVGRLNDNAVNINRNYPVGWGEVDAAGVDPADILGSVLNNPGAYPASEPETQAVVGWWEKLQPDYVASIHCCGNLWLYPYGIEGRDPHTDDALVLARICEEAYAEVREFCGPIWSTIYPASGSSVDTAYELTGAAAFGFEMSGREAVIAWGFPFTAAPVEETESESWRGLLHAFLHVEKYGAHPALAVESVAADSARLVVTNGGWGNLTRATLRLVDAFGAVREVDVPRLAPGASAVVAVAGSFAPGAFDVAVTYQKRALAGDGVVAAVLQVAAAGDGLVGALDAAPTVAPTDAGALPVPAPGAILALAALGAVAALRVRRR